MQWLMVAVLWMAAWPLFAETTARDYCREVDREIEGTNFPLLLDNRSTLVSRKTMYVQGRCVVQNLVEVDSRGVIDDAAHARNAQGLGTHRDTVVESLLSKDGREALIASLRASLAGSEGRALEIPHVTVYAIYKTSDPIPPFTITLESEDGR